MSDIALQIERTLAGSVVTSANVVFDSIVYLAGNISYNNTTGVITFNEAGRYVINWWVGTQTTVSTNGAVFALSSSNGDFLEGVSPIRTGEVVGIGIINVVSAPVTVSLVNGSNNTIFYAVDVPLTATLVVVQDDVSGSTGPTGQPAQPVRREPQEIPAQPVQLEQLEPPAQLVQQEQQEIPVRQAQREQQEQQEIPVRPA